MSFSEPCALAVDFGGTSIKMGVTAGERILATADRIPTAMFESPQAIIDAMIASARTLRGQFPSACAVSYTHLTHSGTHSPKKVSLAQSVPHAPIV